MGHAIVERYSANPILRPSDLPVPCCAVYNSGVAKLPDGSYIMASRYEELNKTQGIWVSRSSDGIHFTPDPRPPVFVCEPEDQMEFDETVWMNHRKGADIGSWFDPRICPVEGKYYLVYCVGGDYGCRIAIAETEDFITLRHVSFPLHSLNRNAVLFPEKIGGEYFMLHRPQSAASSGNGFIWSASSPDLQYWGHCRVVARPQEFWENTKIGPAAPPVKTEAGWLAVYHGVFPHSNGVNYGAGVMLLDLKQPWKVIGRSRDPILYVQELYEMVGQVPNVVFPGAIIPEDDGTVKMYYGAADYVQCLAVSSLQALIDACR